MPYKEFVIKKKYFSIADVVEMLDKQVGVEVNPSALRFWESYLRLTVERTKQGTRRYTQADFKMIKSIALLRHKYYFTLEGIDKILSDKKKFTADVVSFLVNFK